MNNVKFYFSRDFKLIATGNIVSKLKRVPRITICSIFDPDKKVLTFGVSRCSSKDTFVKSIGRKLAFERALNNPYKTIHVSGNEKVSDICIKTCLEIEREVMGMTYPISFKK